MHSFEAEGVAEVEFEADVRGGLRRFFYAWSGDASAEAWPSDKRAGDPVLLRVPDPDPLPAWLTDADIDYYVSEFEQSGFRGPLNRYRNNDRDFAFLRGFEGRRIKQPALYIGGERDRVLQMFGDRLPLMRGALPDLRGLHLPKARVLSCAAVLRMISSDNAGSSTARAAPIAPIIALHIDIAVLRSMALSASLPAARRRSMSSTKVSFNPSVNKVRVCGPLRAISPTSAPTRHPCPGASRWGTLR